MKIQDELVVRLPRQRPGLEGIVRFRLWWTASRQLLSMIGLAVVLALAQTGWAAQQHPPQGYTFYVVPHSHIDLEWYWTYDKTQVLVINILSNALKMLKNDPHYTFAQDQMMALKLFWETLSDSDRIFLRRMVRERRFEVTTGMLVQPDIDEPDFESLSRQLLVAKPWLERTFETKILTAWNIDTFGQTVQMPQLFRRAGLKYFVFMRDVLPSMEASIKSPFYWQSPDGSRLLAHWLSGTYGISPEHPESTLAPFVRHNLEGNDKILLLWGDDLYVPTHTSGDIERIIRQGAAKLGIPVKSVVMTTPSRYFEEIEKSGLSLPTYSYDFNPPLFIQDLRGLWGQRPGQKLALRRSEDALQSSEKFCSIASFYGLPYPAGDLLRAWEKVLFNHNHDNMGGSHTDAVAQATMSRYENAIEAGQATLAQALFQLSRKVDTSQGGRFPFLVFNALSFPRTELVRYEPLFKEELKNFRILDQAGKAVPFRIVATHLQKEGDPLSMAVVEFLADIPALGYRLYRIEEAPATAQPSSWRPARNEISNRFFRLRLDPARGVLASLLDLRSGQELLDTGRYGGNELVLVEEKNPDMEGMIHFTGTEVRSSQFPPDSIKQIDDDLGTRLRIEGPFLGGRRVQEITLYHQLPRIDFETELLGFPGHDGMVTAVFPIRKEGKQRNWYETHNAVTERPDGIYDAGTWALVGDSTLGAALLNRGTAGHIIEKGIVKLILLRSVTNYRGYHAPNASEAGNHSFEYGLYPNAGDWSGGGVVEQAHSFNSPLRVISTDSHPGPLPSEQSFLRVESGQFEVTALKEAEQGGDLILRGHESQGKSGRVRLRLELPVQQAWRADLLEEPSEELVLGKGRVEFDCQPFQFVTIRLRPKH